MESNLVKEASGVEDIKEVAKLYAKSDSFRNFINDSIKEPYAPLFSTIKSRVPLSFCNKGETIYIVGYCQESDGDISSLVELLIETMENEIITTLNSTEEGIFTALVQSSAANRLGFDITALSEVEEHEFLFGSGRDSFIVGVSDEDSEEDFINFCFKNGIEAILLGHTTKGELRVDDLSLGYISHFLS